MKVKEVKKTVVKANKKNDLLHITKKHTGKMRGMQSLSTSCRMNPNCAIYAKIPGSICEKCYAQQMAKRWPTMYDPIDRNTEILTSRILKDDELPIINCLYFRFESFGDLINETQLENYFNICKKNSGVNFALWTKNPNIVKNIADKKPDNLQIVASSLYINKEMDISKMPYIDKVFTVYDKPTIKEKGIEINCGGRSCITCLRCYKKDGEKNIKEQLK